MVMLTDTGGGRDFEPLSASSHVAICDMIVDLGMQEGGKFGPKHQLYFRWQVPEERIEFEKDGEPQNMPKVIGRMFTASLSEKSHLRPFLESWRGRPFTAEELRGFDPVNVAGAAALINVIHEPGNKQGKAVTYANIASIMPLPKGMAKPTLEGEVIIHDENNDSYDKLPKWLQEKLDNQVTEQPQQQPSGGQRPQPAAFDTDLDDDVPF
jgi:hypothetical protein